MWRGMHRSVTNLPRLSHESFSLKQRPVWEVISVMTSRFRTVDGNVVDERAFAQRAN
jgi:hypothetical protein